MNLRDIFHAVTGTKEGEEYKKKVSAISNTGILMQYIAEDKLKGSQEAITILSPTSGLLGTMTLDPSGEVALLESKEGGVTPLIHQDLVIRRLRALFNPPKVPAINVKLQPRGLSN